MTDLDWPAGFERTSAADRERCRKFEATLGATTSDIATEMGRMGVDDWRAETGSGGSHVKSNGLPKVSTNPDDPSFVLQWSKEGEQFAVACDAYRELRDNCREVYLWVHETRLRGQRAVVTGQSEFAAAQLPSGEEDVIVADVGESAHEVLDVAPDADDETIRNAAKQRKIEAHPDHDGSSEELQRVMEAEEMLLE